MSIDSGNGTGDSAGTTHPDAISNKLTRLEERFDNMLMVSGEHYQTLRTEMQRGFDKVWHRIDGMQQDIGKLQQGAGKIQNNIARMQQDISKLQQGFLVMGQQLTFIVEAVSSSTRH